MGAQQPRQIDNDRLERQPGRPGVVEQLERRILLANNTSLATAVDLDPTAVGLQGEAERLGVFDSQRSSHLDEFYKFTLETGELASVALDSHFHDDTFSLRLLDGAGSLIAEGRASTTGRGDRLITDFRAPATGTYYLAVSQLDSQSVYDLVVTRGAAIEGAYGQRPGTALSLDNAGQVLGWSESLGGIDFYGQELAWLSTSRSDGQNFNWEFDYDGAIAEGTDDAFDRALDRAEFPTSIYGHWEAQWRELNLGPYQVGQVSVARKIFVPDDSGVGFARFLEFVTNTSDSVVNHTLRIDTDLGSDSATHVVATSSGGAFSTADNWIVTDDAAGSGDPAILHLFAGPGGERPSAVALDGDKLSFSYDLTLQPGETKVILHFGAQNRSRAEALAKAAVLESLGDQALSFMTPAERAGIVNFAAGGGYDVYDVSVNAGDVLSITTGTLDFEVAPGEEIDPVIELYDEAGNLVASDDNGAADGRNAVISHTTASSGRYSIVVRSAGNRAGHYTLAVTGATGASTGPRVVSATSGEVDSGFPVKYRVTFTDAILPSSVFAGMLQVNGVPAQGASVVDGNTIEFDIAGAQAGEGGYSVTLAAGAATDLAGNPTAAFSTGFSVAGADLVITDATGPSSATIGDTITLAWTVSNLGSRPAHQHRYDRVYLSDDPFFSSNDRLLTNTNHDGETLSPGGSYTVQHEVLLPVSADGGDKYILLITDADRYQPESHEGNNTFALPIALAASDLAPTAASAPAALVVGEQVTVSWSVQNVSPDVVAGGSWYDYVFLSEDEVIDPATDVPLGGVEHIGALAPGGSYDAQGTFTFTGTQRELSAGSYYVLVAANYSGQGEIDRANNTWSIPVQVQAPDLRVDAADAVPESATPGEIINISWEVTNLASFDLQGPWFDYVFLSQDDVFSSDDVMLGGLPMTDPVGAGASYDKELSATIPLSAQAGDQYLIVVANYVGLGESDRGNNTYAVPLSIDLPDLVVTDATAPQQPPIDASFDVSWMVTNQSAAAAYANWYDRIYLSRDASWDPDDAEVGSLFAGDATPLPGGAGYSHTTDVYISGWQAWSGDAYLIVRADGGFGNQAELSEANNDWAIPITLSQPDLGITTAAAPASAGLGETIQVSWKVENLGLSEIDISNEENFFLSDDPYFDWNDYWLDGWYDSSAHFPLAPGASYSAVTDVTIWDDAPAGARYLLVVTELWEAIYEANQENSVFAIPIDIGGPDLVPTSFEAPQELVVGAPTTFDWTVRNEGAAAAASGSWYDGIYLSDDPTFEEGKDTYIGEARFSADVLASGAEYVFSRSFVIPDGPLGQRYLILVADHEQWQGETDESNNVVAIPVEVKAPDLIVSDASAPESAVVGETVELSWTVHNQGDVPALGSWQDRVYISSDPYFSSDDRSVRSLGRLSTLEPGQSYQRTTTAVIPADTAPGTRYLLFFADGGEALGETNEANNVLAVPIALAGPDLVVTEVTGVPSAAVLGSSFDVTFTVTNASDVDALAGSWYDAIFISSDPYLDFSDTFVDREQREDSLPAGQSYTVVEGITLPPTATGIRYLLVVTDRYATSSSNNNRQGETDEANNVYAIPIELTATDLSVTAASAPPSAAANETIDISFTVSNLGTTAAPGSWDDAVFLSTDPVLHGYDTQLQDFDADDHSPLNPGHAYDVNGQVTLPNVQAGSYYLLFVADEDNDLGETDEQNNFIALPIEVGAPDLTVSTASGPDSAIVGTQVQVNWTVLNQGAVTARADWEDRIYLSSDTTLGGDTLLATVDRPEQLPADASYEMTANVVIPVQATGGAKYLLVVADGGLDQVETDETNNVFAVPLDVHAPDLVVSEVTGVPAFAAVGESFEIGFTVRNDGSIDALQAAWYDSIYISDDELLDFSDAFVDRVIRSHASLPAGDGYTVNRNITIPGVDAGGKYVLVVTDRYSAGSSVNNNRQGESDETNNVVAVPIELTAADLVVTDPAAPAVATAGELIDVSWSVTNQGTTVAPADWFDGVYVSLDAVFSGDDQLVATFSAADHTPLAAGDSYNAAHQMKLPDLAAGEYHLLFAADALGDQGETNETNNVASTTISIGNPELVPVELIAPPAASAGEVISVSWTVRNDGAFDAWGEWFDGIYLSQDAVPGSDQLLASVSAPGAPVAPGDTYTLQADVTIPESLTSGGYHLVLAVDRSDQRSETNEQNNHLVVPISVGVADLAVTDLTVPAAISQGERIDLSWTVRNDGGAPATGTWRDRVYLSPDATFDGSDVLLVEHQVHEQSPLAAGDSYTVMAEATVPAFPEGAAYVIVVTDQENDVAELSDANNAAAAAVAVKAFDLAVESISGPTSGVTGQQVEVTWTLRNTGGADLTGTWEDIIFLSNDATAGADIQLESFPVTTTIPAGETLVRTQVVTLPAVPDGAYHFVVSADGYHALDELDRGNNTLVSAEPIQIAAAPAPNLQVSEVTVPVTSVERGQPFTVSWTVTNTGNGPTNASFWRDRVYLSVDESLDGTDQFLADVQNPTFLNAGEGYNHSAAVTITGVSEGDYYLIVATDATNKVAEAGGEGDNTTTGPQVHVSLPPPPDMVVESVQAPEVAFSGQPMAITYNVANVGDGDVAVGTWQDRIYLSLDETLDDGDFQLLEVTRMRSAGGTYTATYSPATPPDMTGTFYVIVETDATNRIDEFAFEQNNTGFDPNPVTVNLTPPPDLEFTAFDAPAATSAGRPFTVSYTVYNLGTTATLATSWRDAFFLSTDDQLDVASDLRIGTQGITLPNGLAADAGYSRVRSLATPADLASGQYYLFAVTDIDDQVYELDNGNNVLPEPVPMTIESRPADLNVLGLDTIEPGQSLVGSGGSLALLWGVRNDGLGGTIRTSWDDEVWMTIDEVIGNEDDRRLGTKRYNGGLVVGDDYTQGLVVQMPWDVVGDVHLYLRTDARDLEYEGLGGEVNNVSSLMPMQVVRAGSDLEVSGGNFTADNGRLRFDWLGRNLGPGFTVETEWSDKIYISGDDVFGNDDDVALASLTHRGRLEPQQGYVRSHLLDVPAAYEGIYHFFVEVNADRRLQELSDYGNNVVYSGSFDTTALRMSPDLVVHEVNAPIDATAGRPVEIEWTVRNIGDAIPRGGSTPPQLPKGTWRDNIYLSRDQVFDPNDLFLGQATITRQELYDVTEGDDTLQEYRREQSFMMPAGQTGAFYVFVVTDRYMEVAEADEENNLELDEAAMHTSLAPAADLSIGQITLPESGETGEYAIFEYEIHNAGPGDVHGDWLDRLYLSVDDQYSPDDMLIGSRGHSYLNEFGQTIYDRINAGESETYFLASRLPGVVPGDYHVVVRTDAYNAIPEGHEHNNIGVSLASFTVDVPRLDLADGADSRNVRASVYDQQTESFYFAFDAAEGQTIQLEGIWNHIDMSQFDPDYWERHAMSSAYVAFERIPSPFDYDHAEARLLLSTENGGSGEDLIIPRTQEGTYFVRLDIRDASPNSHGRREGEVFVWYHPGSQEDMDLSATVLPFDITTVTPGTVGNSGRATFGVIASGFDICSSAELLLDGQVAREAVDVYLDPADASRAFLTFDLAGLEPGEYELRVVGERGAVASEQVQVAAGTGPRSEAALDGPAQVREGDEYMFYVNYGNNGDADASAPLLLLENVDSNPFALSREALHHVPHEPRMIQLLGISHDGPAGTLRPGSLGSIPVFFEATEDAGDWRVTRITGDEQRPIDLELLEAEVRPDDVDDLEWSAIWPVLQELIGSTWGSYVQALGAVASELGSSGLRTPDVEVLFGALYLRARLGLGAPVAQGLVVGEGCIAVPGASVSAIGADGSVLESVTANDQSRFEFRDLAPGTYTLLVEAAGYARKILHEVVVPAEGALRVDVHLNPEAAITATIDTTLVDPGHEAFAVVARRVGSENATDAYDAVVEEGRVRVAGLPAGTYELLINAAGFLQRRFAELVVVPGETLDLGHVELDPASTISGSIVFAGQGITDEVSVGAYNLAGELLASAVVEDDLTYKLPGLDAGAYVLRLIGSRQGFPEELAVELEAGEQLTGADIEVLPGGTIAGTVIRSFDGAPLAGIGVIAVGEDSGRIGAITDSEGRYQIAGLSVGTYAVMLEATGITSSAEIEVTELDGEYAATLVADSVASITGRVSLPTDAPVVDAYVELLLDGEVVVGATTDADGRYSLLLLEPGTYGLTASLGDASASFLPTGAIEVTEGVALVRDFVAGTASASITISGGSGTSFITFSQTALGSVRDLAMLEVENGEILLENLAAGTYEVSVLRDGLVGSASFAVTNGGSAQASVALSSVGTVSGLVLDETGMPIASAIVSLLNSADGRRMFAITQSDGSYELPHVAAGDYDVSVFALGRTPHVQPGLQIAGGGVVVNHVLTSGSSPISGRLVDWQENAAPEASVVLFDAAGRAIGMAEAAADGSFVVDAPAGAGSLVLRAYASGAPAVIVEDLSADSSVGDIIIKPVALAQYALVETEPDADEGWNPQHSSEFRPTWSEVFFGDFDPGAVPSLETIPPTPLDCLPERNAVRSLILDLQAIRKAILSEEAFFDEYRNELLVILPGEVLIALGKAVEVGLVIHSILGGLSKSAAGAAKSAFASKADAVKGYLSNISTLVGGLASSIKKAGQAVKADNSQALNDEIAAVGGLITQIVGLANTAATYLTKALSDASVDDLKKIGKVLSTLSAIKTVVELLDGDGGDYFKETLKRVDLMTSSLARMRALTLQFDAKKKAYLEAMEALNECLWDHLDGNHDDRPSPTPPDGGAADDGYRPGFVLSLDPNDIIGPAGFGEENWVPARTALPYMIRFENVPEATAPAQRVMITQQLDADLDWRSFRVREIGFGDVRLHLPGDAGFHQSRIDLPDELGFDVDVIATIDTLTGVATWILQAVDPATGEAPEDALAGFLPPNDEEGSGEGFVTYTIRAADGVASGTRIDAQATIVFDTNEPIDTPAIFNTLDAAAPQSSVAPLPAVSDSADFLAAWGGQEEANGSGVVSYDVYVSRNNGPFTLWLGGTDLVEATFSGLPGYSYAFYSLARDYAGNVEPPPATADAATTVAGSSDIVIDTGGDAALVEGDALSRVISFVDPAAAGPWLVTVDYGDGSEPVSLLAEDPAAIALDHLYVDDGDYTVTITVTNDEHMTGIATFLANVVNAAPVVDAGADLDADEGNPFSFAGAFTDAGLLDTHTIHWDFGDGSTAEGTLTPAHAYAENGTYNVTLTVTDDDGGVASSTLQVVVSNVAPVAAFVNDGPVMVDQPVTVSFVGAFDPSAADMAAGFTYSFDFDNDGVFEVISAAPAAQHAFADAGDHVVTGRIQDKDGDFTDYTTTVTVGSDSQVAPVIDTLSTDGPVAEGSVLTLTGTFTDPDADDAFTLRVAWGDGQIETISLPAGQRSFAVEHVYADNTGAAGAEYTIDVTLTDSADLSDTATTTALVTNVDPAAGIVGAPDTALEGDLISLTAGVTDPGTLDTFTYEWSVTKDGALFATGTDAAFAFTPDDQGSYVITLRVTDKDGGVGDAEPVAVAVGNADPVTSATPPSAGVQYSDVIPTILVEADDPGDDQLSVTTYFSIDGGATFVPGLPQGLVLNDGPETDQWSLAGTADVAPGTYIIRLAVTDGEGGSADQDVTVNVAAENAAVAWTGKLYVPTFSSRNTTVQVTLSASVQDSSIFDPDDAAAGDVRNARVTFHIFDAMTDAVVDTVSDVPVVLTDAGDATLGVASIDWTAVVGENQGRIFRVVATAGDRYLGSSHGDLLTVGCPVIGSLHGGGYLINEASAGLLAGDAGLKTGFGFHAGADKLGNMRGEVAMLIRRTESDGVLHTYLVRGTSIQSVSGNSRTGDALVEAGVSVFDVTDWANPILVEGDATLRFDLFDGMRRSPDRAGITLRRGDGELLFSSRWNGLETEDDVLDAGDVRIV